MNRAHKIELILNKHFGSSRLAWNTCIAEGDRAYKHGEGPSQFSIQRWWRTLYALRQAHYSIASCRNDYIHKFTAAVTRKYGVIALEDLNVQGMVKNHSLARAKELRLVGRFAPSSKTCSSCGHGKHDVTLKDRIYVCPDCDLEKDRDLNAAINISRWATPVPDVDKKALARTTVDTVALAKLCLDEASSGLQFA
ncbi:MAG: transposase [Treponema sp.]|nr:transposase [Treponema sp.]